MKVIKELVVLIRVEEGAVPRLLCLFAVEVLLIVWLFGVLSLLKVSPFLFSVCLLPFLSSRHPLVVCSQVQSFYVILLFLFLFMFSSPAQIPSFSSLLLVFAVKPIPSAFGH